MENSRLYVGVINMMSAGMSIRHPKARGEWAELRFMLRATELGLPVTKPWGDNSPYDLVIETSGRFLRVQVKSATRYADNRYRARRLTQDVCFVSSASRRRTPAARRDEWSGCRVCVNPEARPNSPRRLGRPDR